MKDFRAVAGIALVVGLLAGCSSGDVPTVGLSEEGIAQEMPADDTTMDLSDVPDGWPSDIPIPPGGRLEAWTQPFDNQINASWRVEQVDTTGSDFVYDNLLLDASSMYNDALGQLEWSESEHLATEESGEGRYVAEDRTVTFTATPTEDGAVSFYVEYVAAP